jgi:hypothetical protein
MRNEHQKDPDLTLFYSAYFYLYTLAVENDYKSLFKFQDYLRFYKPKTIAFDLLEEEYLKKYDPIVRSKNFRESMKRVEADITLKQTQGLETLGRITRLRAHRPDIPIHFLPLLHFEVRCRLRGETQRQEDAVPRETRRNQEQGFAQHPEANRPESRRNHPSACQGSGAAYSKPVAANRPEQDCFYQAIGLNLHRRSQAAQLPRIPGIHEA